VTLRVRGGASALRARGNNQNWRPAAGPLSVPGLRTYGRNGG
jgi:hypothetical protein